MKKQLNEENTRLRQQIEQERRDHELALRLAHESNSSIEDLNTPQVRTSNASYVKLSWRLTSNMSSWKTQNTSWCLREDGKTYF